MAFARFAASPGSIHNRDDTADDVAGHAAVASVLSPTVPVGREGDGQ